MNSLTSLSVKQLRQAAGIKVKIERLEKQLSRMLGPSADSQEEKTSRKKRRISAAAKRKMSLAAKARWAKVNGKKRSIKTAPKAKRKISAAGIARIRAAQKARWAKVKADKK